MATRAASTADGCSLMGLVFSTRVPTGLASAGPVPACPRCRHHNLTASSRAGQGSLDQWLEPLQRHLGLRAHALGYSVRIGVAAGKVGRAEAQLAREQRRGLEPDEAVGDLDPT